MMCWLWSAASTSFATCVLAFSKFSAMRQSFKIRLLCAKYVDLISGPCSDVVLCVHTSKVSVEILQPPDLGH